MSDDGFRRVETLEVDFLVETPEVKTSPRGWAEAIVEVAVARDAGDYVELKFRGSDEVQRVSKAALRAMLELGDGIYRPDRWRR